MRQPQARNASLLMVSAVTRKVADASANATDGPSCGNNAYFPRALVGAFSAVSRVAPAHSPPTARPCRMRSTTSRIGARTPIVPVVGSRPMASVEKPISSSVVTSVPLRPRRSPKWPNSTDPNGRATKATPNVASASAVPAAAPSSGKKTLLNTRAAAVP